MIDIHDLQVPYHVNLLIIIEIVLIIKEEENIDEKVVVEVEIKALLIVEIDLKVIEKIRIVY